MGIWVNRDTRVIVQGITGREGAFHTRQMMDYGTRVVAGVTPGRAGQTDDGVPVFDTMEEAVSRTQGDASVIFVPAPVAADAMLEAGEAGVRLVACITEGIPTWDMVRVAGYFRTRGIRLVGPNGPGLLTAGETKLGIMPGDIFRPGPVGIVSRSGTLTYEVVSALSARGLGQTTAVGIGGDPIIGTTFVDVLRAFEQDPVTRCVVLLGEIGGTDEEEAARLIAHEMSKPVVAFIAGLSAPADRRMGHAGAIVSAGAGTAADKIAALKRAGVQVAAHPEQVAELVAATL